MNEGSLREMRLIAVTPVADGTTLFAFRALDGRENFRALSRERISIFTFRLGWCDEEFTDRYTILKDLKPYTYNSHKVYYGISLSTIRSDIYADILPNQANLTAVQAFVWREQSCSAKACVAAACGRCNKRASTSLMTRETGSSQEQKPSRERTK